MSHDYTEVNKEIAREFADSPKYLIHGIRGDSHRGVEQADETEEMLLNTWGEVVREITHKPANWKVVNVYDIKSPILTLSGEEIKEGKKLNQFSTQL